MNYFARLRSFLASATARLALSYLAIIMLMSIGFSVVFYNASSRELGRGGPRPDDSSQNSSSDDDSRPDDRPRFGFARDPEFEEFLAERAAEGRHALLMRLIYLNLLALLAGSALSYYLARRTLEPIEENMEAQAQFVSDASHELRTPLTALQTTNEVALRKPKLAEAEARDLLAYNVAEVAKLKALTDGLLRLARQDKHDMVRQAVSLQEVASDALNAVIAPAQAKRISIADHVPRVRVLGDPAGLAQTVVILLDNAIKYSPAGSRITLGGGKHGKTGYITVTDQGQGIAKADLPHIFDRFYRADQSRTRSAKTTSTEHQTDGYGIGLALAKKIIHQMGGELAVSSHEGKGSTFTIQLPLA